MTRQDELFEEIFRRTDQALYEAKGMGNGEISIAGKR